MATATGMGMTTDRHWPDVESGMQPSWDKGAFPSPIGAAFSVGAGIYIAVGAASLIDAADGRQDILRTASWLS